METQTKKTTGEGQTAVLRSGDLFGETVRKHNLAVESLTEQQLAEVIRQAIASGDIVRNVTHDGSAQAITYIPYREVSRLRDQYHELLYAVASKHDGETRHETALRYIKEREDHSCGDCDPCLGGRPDQCALSSPKKADMPTCSE